MTAGRIELYVTSGLSLPESDGQSLALLDAAEQDRLSRMPPGRHRQLFLESHVFLRKTLGQALGCAPADVVYAVDPDGKPHLARSHGQEVQFNLSHTGGMIAVALGKVAAVGVDVENRCRRANHRALAKRFFASQEADVVEQVAEEERAPLFSRIWTLKEAFVKAEGRGLRIPLSRFSFEFQGPMLRFACDQGVAGPVPEKWHFAQLQIGGYVTALACPHEGKLCCSVHTDGEPYTVLGKTGQVDLTEGGSAGRHSP